MNKLWLALIIMLTLYAPLELSRLITSHKLTAEFIFELVFLWTFYIGGMLLVWRRTRRVAR